MTALFDDPVTAPFWDAAQEQRLIFQRCAHCRSAQLYPRALCRRCHRRDIEWEEASGSGTLYSVTVVHVAVSDTIATPHAVGIVELEEGPRILAPVTPIDVTIGSRMVLRWLLPPEGAPIAAFEQLETGSHS